MKDISLLPEKARQLFDTAFSVAKEELGDDEQASFVAWEALSKHFRHVGNEWIEKQFEADKEPEKNDFFANQVVTKSDGEESAEDKTAEEAETSEDTTEEAAFDEEGVAKALTAEQRNNLPDADFAYVETAPDGSKVRKLPIHDAAHVRNALARFSQTQGIPSDKKQAVLRKIIAKAKELGVEVSEDMLSEAGL